MNIGAVSGLGVPPLSEGAGGVGAQPASSGSFARIVEHFLDQANTNQTQADQAVRALAAGQTDNLHQVLLSAAKADLTFRMVLEIRNRLTEAFQEIMRMQV